MKCVSIKAAAMAIAVAGAATQCSLAVSVIFDSFSEGSFHLQNGGDDFHHSGVFSPLLLDTRRVYSGGNGTWSVTLASGTGVLEYNVDEILSTARFGLSLRYTRGTSGQGWSLLGYDALVFDFTNVTGEGMLDISVPNQNFDEMVRRSVTTPGQLIYPLEDLAANNLGSISDMAIRFTPITDSFSFSLNEITVVPEPSVSGMLVPLAALLVGRRTRRN